MYCLLARDYSSKQSTQEARAVASPQPSSLGAAPVVTVSGSPLCTVTAAPLNGTSHRGRSPPVVPSRRRSRSPVYGGRSSSPRVCSRSVRSISVASSQGKSSEGMSRRSRCTRSSSRTSYRGGSLTPGGGKHNSRSCSPSQLRRSDKDCQEEQSSHDFVTVVSRLRRIISFWSSNLSLLGNLRGLLKLVQRHITLQTEGTPRLLKVMCPEHPDDALINRLQQRLGVRQQEDELDVAMQVLQHVGVGGSVIQNRQDMEGEALRRAILLQLVHQGSPAVCQENMSRHPATGIGASMNKQVGLFITLECTRVLGMVDQDGLQLAVFRQISPQQEGETVLERFEALGRLLLPREVCAFRHLLPLQACFTHVEHLLVLVNPPPPP